MQHTLGIDVSKDRLDAHLLRDGSHRTFPNDRAGIAGLMRWLMRWLVREGGPLAVFESTGRSHVALERALGQAGLAFHRVNPLQAGRFAERCGRLAKTDRIDAASLARMGAALDLAGQAPAPDNRHALKELLTAYRTLVASRAGEKTRAGAAPSRLLSRQIAVRIRLLDRQIEQLRAAMAAAVAADPWLARRVAVLASIPGIGSATAIARAVDMPELGTLTKAEAASLAGLAPVVRQSGRRRGQERIRGGRPALRRALYMPALVAMRFNAGWRAKAERLAERGKPAKVVITAVMRNLVILANTLIAQDRMWQPTPP